MSDRIIKKCKDCNKPFSISSKELQWLQNNGLQPFSRCGSCRKSRKLPKKQAYPQKGGKTN